MCKNCTALAFSHMDHIGKSLLAFGFVFGWLGRGLCFILGNGGRFGFGIGFASPLSPVGAMDLVQRGPEISVAKSSDPAHQTSAWITITLRPALNFCLNTGSFADPQTTYP